MNKPPQENTPEDAFADAEPELATAAKYSDLLKMHAYRDAIRRTAGAYVLYPGTPSESSNKQFEGFHEVLPGLGAFAISPDKDGKPKGIPALSEFLDKVIEHLAHRTTARERTTYHVREAYHAKEVPAVYGSVRLKEEETYFGKEFRALPPAEEIVLVAWYQNDAQLALAQHDQGFLYVRLGDRRGALHIHPNFAQVRRVILRTYSNTVAPGTFLLRELGYNVYTRLELRKVLNREAKQPGVSALTWRMTRLIPDSSPSKNSSKPKLSPYPNDQEAFWEPLKGAGCT